jgi:hypothetical protein
MNYERGDNVATIIDKRKNKDSVSKIKNKFFKRQRAVIQQQIDALIKQRKIKNILNPTSKKITIPSKNMYEPTFHYDYDKLKGPLINTDNNFWEKGDKFYSRSDPSGSGSGSGGGGEDDFSFLLTKDEFVRLLFENLALPNFIKKSGDIKKYVTKRSGYIKEGTPSKLDLRKTFENAIARRFALRATDPPFLDDIDLRYKHYKRKPIPWRSAVMFCCMDVSGSMGEDEKLRAKKFYILLFMFLRQKYKTVDIVFIRYHSSAKECDEDEFFYSRETGGTVISEALELTNSIIRDRYPSSKWNIYIAHTSDGDNFSSDNAKCNSILEGRLLPSVQYYLHYNVRPPQGAATGYWSEWDTCIKDIEKRYENVVTGNYTGKVFSDFSKFFSTGL